MASVISRGKFPKKQTVAYMRATSRSADKKRTPDEDYLGRRVSGRSKWKKCHGEKGKEGRAASAKSSVGVGGGNSRSLHYFAAFWRGRVSARRSIREITIAKSRPACAREFRAN